MLVFHLYISLAVPKLTTLHQMKFKNRSASDQVVAVSALPASSPFRIGQAEVEVKRGCYLNMPVQVGWTGLKPFQLVHFCIFCTIELMHYCSSTPPGRGWRRRR